MSIRSKVVPLERFRLVHGSRTGPKSRMQTWRLLILLTQLQCDTARVGDMVPTVTAEPPPPLRHMRAHDLMPDRRMPLKADQYALDRLKNASRTP